MLPYPPTDGSVRLSDAVDFHLKHHPSSPAYVYASDSSERPVVIKYLEFARACHRAARFIRPSPSNPDHSKRPVIAIIALCDTLVYQAIMLGVHKAGCIPFPISPRNSPAAIALLLKATACHRVISTSATLKPLLDGLSSQLSDDGDSFALDIHEVPPLKILYPKLGAESADDPFIPYAASLPPPDLSDVALYLHSSGSTGFPKVVPLTERNIVSWAALPSVSNFITRGYPALLGAMALPSFHTLGIYTQVLVPLFTAKPVAIYPPTRHADADLPIMPTPDNILTHTRNTKCDGLMVIPTLLQIWSHSPSSIDILKSLRIVTYAGGSLPPRSGEALASAGVVIRPIYGGTEFGAPSHWVPLEGDSSTDRWQWIDLSDGVNVSMVPQGNGTYELHFLRGQFDHINVYNLPEKAGYATSDIFEKHPTKNGLWKIVGRKDDVIVHATGEKTVPGPLEDIIASHAAVRGTVIFGERQNQPGVLLELADGQRYPKNDEELESIREMLWPIIEEANGIAPAFSRIYKDMILIASPDKPLPRAGKGTVMRKAALAVYAAEIQSLYNIIEAGTQNNSARTFPNTWTVDCLRDWLASQASDLLPNKSFSPTSDLFSQGFDSLSATLLRHRIVAAMRSHPDTSVRDGEMSQTLVYDYPTIEKLATAVEDFVSGKNISTEDRIARIESMIQTSVSQFEPMDTPNPLKSTSDEAVVLLTGSTGGLGAYILSGLLNHTSAPLVYTMDRMGSGSVKQRQEKACLDRGLDCSIFASKKLISLCGDLSQPDFALGEAMYKKLRESVTIIIHNAWTLDFNLPLTAYERLVTGTRHLINLARRGPRSTSVRFLFTSSISAAQSWNQDTPVPEEVILDPKVSIGTGYGESKYVAERVLFESGLQTCSLRIGQVSGGSPRGAWSTTDWVPILVKSSIFLKKLPDSAGTISWVPMDRVAQAVLDAAFHEGPLPSVMNITHPRPVVWTKVFSFMRVALRDAIGIDLPLVPFEKWFNDVLDCAQSLKGLEVERLPALKLLSFFERIKSVNNRIHQGQDSCGASFSTDIARRVTAALRDAEELEMPDAVRWVEYWANEGIFS